MTAEQALDNLKNVIEAARQESILKVAIPATTRLLGEVKNRIQRRGEKTDGSQIGQYSVKPMYASIEQFDKKSAFKPQGKRESIEYATVNIHTKKAKRPKRQTVKNFGETIPTRNQEGFNFEERKSMYLPGGYKELRNIQGKDISKVNITYRGDLMNDYQQAVGDTEITHGLVSEESALMNCNSVLTTSSGIKM